MLQKHEWLHYCYSRRGLNAISEQWGSESGSILGASVSEVALGTQPCREMPKGERH